MQCSARRQGLSIVVVWIIRVFDNVGECPSFLGDDHSRSLYMLFYVLVDFILYGDN